MRNLPFVIWMLGLPLIKCIDAFVFKYFLEKTYSDDVEVISAIIFLIIWIFIGILVYEKE